MTTYDLHAAPTPNGKKIPIAFEEMGIPYNLHRVDFSKKEQKSPEFLALNPNGKIPAMVAHDGAERIVIFESGAILEFLAMQSGKLLPKGAKERAEVMSWLFWQVGGPGPMFGQAGAFSRETPRNEPAYEKFLTESKRLASVLDGQVKDREYVAGDYSIADIALFPWFEGMKKFAPDVLVGVANVDKWIDRVAARPAVQKANAVWDAPAS